MNDAKVQRNNGITFTFDPKSVKRGRLLTDFQVLEEKRDGKFGRNGKSMYILFFIAFPKQPVELRTVRKVTVYGNQFLCLNTK